MTETQKFVCFVIGQSREQLVYAAYVEHAQKLDFAVVYLTGLVHEHCGHS